MGSIPSGTYYAVGNEDGAYPNVEGLGFFNGQTAAGGNGVWTLFVVDFFADNIGTVESVELTITCE